MYFLRGITEQNFMIESQQAAIADVFAAVME
jgi:hypothetical protein